MFNNESKNTKEASIIPKVDHIDADTLGGPFKA